MQEKLFLVEGKKSILEVAHSDYKIVKIIATSAFIEENNGLVSNEDTFRATEKELSSWGSLKNNNSAIAIVKQMENDIVTPINKEEWVLALCDIKDPGNLGTILRTADWYGIKNVVASPECVDYYNPRAVQASMGSFTRIQYFTTPLLPFLHHLDRPVYGADMHGMSVYEVNPDRAGVVLLGSESHGLPSSLDEVISQRITIPRIGGAESLNVAVSSAIILDNFIGKH
ncbi:MAG: RNA methyltransferase [Cyclobacteriaceae bacterium]|nr:RNA methyltransferase [Cyclobacteriaceae bacterium]